MEIQRSSPVPLYRQLYDILRGQIEIGEYKTNTAIPTEEKLAEMYGVSRVTTRKALQMLADDRLVIRQPGKGTFVCPQKIEENLHSLQGFAELMSVEQPQQIMEVISFEVIPVNENLAQILGLNDDSKALRIKRRHVVEDHPVAYAIIYLPFDLGKSFTPAEVATTPIYALLTEKAGIVIKRATQRVAAVAANYDIANMLNISLGSPMLMVKRVTYSTEERPLEYIQLYYPGGQHELIMELYRDAAWNAIRNNMTHVTSNG